MSKKKKNQFNDSLSPLRVAQGASGTGWRWNLSLFLGVFSLYCVTRDHFYDFDGILYGGIIEKPLFGALPSSIIYEWNHFLWYPATRAFYVILQKLGLHFRGYETLQTFDALLGALGIVLVFNILIKRVSRPWALVWSLLGALSHIYWVRSVGAVNYLSATFWLICFLWFYLAYFQTHSFWNLIGMCVCSSMAIFFHIGNFAIFLSIFFAIVISHHKQYGIIFSRLFWSAVFVGGSLVPYAWVHQWFEPGGFNRWWLWGSSLVYGVSPIGKKAKSLFDILKGVADSIVIYLQSILAFDSYNLLFFIKTAIFFGLFGALIWVGLKGHTRQTIRDNPAKLFGIPLLSFFVLYAYWVPGNIIYWALPPVLTFMIFCWLLYPANGEPVGKPRWVLVSALLAFVGINNLFSAILPNWHGKSVQVYVQACRTIERVTPPGSPIVISGRKWGLLKPYIPYFLNRNRLAVELFVINNFGPGKDPMYVLDQTIRSFIGQGIPVYATRDALTCSNLFLDFNVTTQSVDSVWRPYTPLLVATLGKESENEPENALYLLWTNAFPAHMQEPIIARLRDSKLWDQLILIYQEKLRAEPSNAAYRNIINVLKTQAVGS